MKLTNPDKVLYPATGTTKAEVFDYYVSIAEAMIPHIAGRAVTRKRWPNGVDEPAFFEKQLASSAPDWLDRASITHRSGTTTYPVIDMAKGGTINGVVEGLNPSSISRFRSSDPKAARSSFPRTAASVISRTSRITAIWLPSSAIESRTC